MKMVGVRAACDDNIAVVFGSVNAAFVSVSHPDGLLEWESHP